MIVQRLPRRSPWRALRLHRAVEMAPAQVLAHAPSVSAQITRWMSSSGMDAFMEFEREMAMKRRQANPKPRVRLERPIPPKDDECCGLDCPNCVLLVYQEKLLEYELGLQGDATVNKPDKPQHKYTITYLNAVELTAEQQELLRLNAKQLYTIKRNELITQPHTTKDGFVRSVRHIDLQVGDDQHTYIGDHASNIAVFVPNDADIVECVAAHLQVDPDLMFTIEDKNSEAHHVERPFEQIGSVRDTLTWSLDVISTPRSSFLRQLAAYARDDAEITALTAPNAAETIKANRPGKRITIADILDMFPSVQLDFTAFYQFAPRNAPRYYTVSSSRRLYPDTVSITLGLRKLESQPTPRCSSYLARLQPDVDRVRASFFRSSFVFPYQDRHPIMLISAGTGIAPFRAFLQDLEHEQTASGEANHREAYLFYGCRRRELDFLYGDDIERAHERGYLDGLFVEFSDTPAQSKRYVQDALAEQGELVARHLLQQRGYVFICGSLAMGRAAKRAIVHALREHGHMFSGDDMATSEEAAKQFLMSCLAQGRVVTELW